MTDNETLELVEEYIYLEQAVSVNPAQDKEIKRRIGMGWHLTGEQEQKLRSAQRGMERKLLGITWRDRKRAT